MLDLKLAQSANKPADATKALKDAVKLLNEGDLKRNPVGRAMVYGKTLSMWMGQPSMASGIATRGAWASRPTRGSFDLVAGIDSAFSIVEASNPDCAAQTGRLSPAEGLGRPGQPRDRAWQRGGPDGSRCIASVPSSSTRTLRTAYLVLAKAAAEKNQPEEAINYYKQAATWPRKDTSAAMQDNRATS